MQLSRPCQLVLGSWQYSAFWSVACPQAWGDVPGQTVGDCLGHCTQFLLCWKNNAINWGPAFRAVLKSGEGVASRAQLTLEGNAHGADIIVFCLLLLCSLTLPLQAGDWGVLWCPVLLALLIPADVGDRTCDDEVSTEGPCLWISSGSERDIMKWPTA
jgi:hypothetical protein